jgi:hypothetical protein
MRLGRSAAIGRVLPVGTSNVVLSMLSRFSHSFHYFSDVLALGVHATEFASAGRRSY